MSFNEGVDTWFDKVVDNPCLHTRTAQRLDAISQQQPTRWHFTKFREALLGSIVPRLVSEDRSREGVPWVYDLTAFANDINNGKFRNEFRFTASRHRAQCSQVSELFSLFQQALHYNG